MKSGQKHHRRLFGCFVSAVFLTESRVRLSRSSSVRIDSPDFGSGSGYCGGVNSLGAVSSCGP